MTDDVRQRLSHRFSSWIRKNALAPVEVGSAVIVVGVLISCAVTHDLARRLAANDLPDAGTQLIEFMAVWGLSLAIILAGHLWSDLGSPEDESPDNQERPQHSTALAMVIGIKRSGVLAFAVGLMMTFWGSIAAVSVAAWFRSYFGGAPGLQWIADARRLEPQALAQMSLSWLVAMALVAGGLLLMWNGIRRHTRVHDSSA
jgi:hypothetical protein